MAKRMAKANLNKGTGDKRMKKKRWKARLGNLYYYIEWDIFVDNAYDYNSEEELRLYKIGNYFRTRKEAEAMARKIKKVLRGEK